MPKESSKPIRKLGRPMPTFSKSSTELRRAFDSAVANLSQPQVRVVFGYPCLFVNGYMTVGLFGDDLFLRLSEGDQTVLREQGGKPLSVMPGRAMAGYTVAPKALWSSPAKLQPWVKRAVAQARSLPPKAKKTSSKKRT